MEDEGLGVSDMAIIYLARQLREQETQWQHVAALAMGLVQVDT